MDKQPYSDQHLTRYICGSLSAEETEHLDELSFTDDDFAGRLHTVENELVDAYVRGELSAQALERFNTFYLSSTKRYEKVRFAQALQTLTQRAASEQQSSLKKSTSESPDSHWKGWRRFVIVPRFAWQWSLPAVAATTTLLLLAMGGWLAIENLRLRQQINVAQAGRDAIDQRERELRVSLDKQTTSATENEREVENLRQQIAQLEQQTPRTAQAPTQRSPPLLRAAPNIMTFALAAPTRSVAQPATVSIATDIDYVAMQLELETGEYAYYRASLKAPPYNQSIWRSGKLRALSAGESSVIIVSLSPDLLKSQRYLLEVSGISPSGRMESLGSYPFRVVKQK